jgi:acetyltransferase-like isoleucine patch superfamily enzyme
MYKFIINLILRYKYRNFKFQSEGSGCSYKGYSSSFPYSERISIGNNVFIGEKALLDGAGYITLGNGVILAPEVCIYSRTHNFDSEDLNALPFDNKILVAEVKIGDYVWIGRRAIILPGVSIGKAAVIGAGAVVSRDVPDNAVVVGNPGKVVKFRNCSIVDRLLESEEPFVYRKYGHSKVFVAKK